MFVALLTICCLAALPTHGEHNVNKYFIFWKEPPDLPAVNKTCIIASHSPTLVKVFSYVLGTEKADRESTVSRGTQLDDWCDLHKRENWSNASLKVVKLESTTPVTLSVVMRSQIVLGSFLVPPRVAWDSTYFIMVTAAIPSVLLLSDDDIVVTAESQERDTTIDQDKIISLSRYVPSELTFTNVGRMIMCLTSGGQFSLAAVSCATTDTYKGCYTSEVYLGTRYFGMSHVLPEALEDTESIFVVSATVNNYISHGNSSRRIVGYAETMTGNQSHSFSSTAVTQCVLQNLRAVPLISTIIPISHWTTQYLAIVPVLPEASCEPFLHVTFKTSCRENIICGTNKISNILLDVYETKEMGMMSGYVWLEMTSVDVYSDIPGCNFMVYLLGKEGTTTLYRYPLGFVGNGLEPFTMLPAVTTTEKQMQTVGGHEDSTSITGPQLCMPGMYGSSCHDECQCNGQACRQDGNCSTTGCGVGLYSKSCLSVDALIFANFVSPAILSDWNKSTCSHLDSDTIHLRFPEVFPLESFTLVFQSQAHVTHMSLKFDSTSKEEYHGDMETVDHTHVTFRLNPALLSSQYIITVRTDTMLCSMHVYGGMEVTGLTAAILNNGVKSDHLDSQANKLVTDEPNLAQCLDLDSNIVMVTMPSLTHITRIVVFTKEPSSAEVSLRGVREKDVVFKLSRTLRHQVNSINVMMSLDGLEISIKTGNVSLCGVKFFQSAADHVEVRTTDLYTSDIWRQTTSATAPQMLYSTAQDSMTLERIMAYFSIAFATAIFVFACLVWYFRKRFV